MLVVSKQIFYYVCFYFIEQTLEVETLERW